MATQGRSVALICLQNLTLDSNLFPKDVTYDTHTEGEMRRRVTDVVVVVVVDSGKVLTPIRVCFALCRYGLEVEVYISQDWMLWMSHKVHMRFTYLRKYHYNH